MSLHIYACTFLRTHILMHKHFTHAQKHTRAFSYTRTSVPTFQLYLALCDATTLLAHQFIPFAYVLSINLSQPQMHAID